MRLPSHAPLCQHTRQQCHTGKAMAGNLQACRINIICSLLATHNPCLQKTNYAYNDGSSTKCWHDHRGIPCQALYCNANSLASTLGEGNHGYLGALMTTPTYLTATQPNATAFIAPIFPGYLPVVQGTAAQVSNQVRANNENLCKWKEYENVTKALWKQLIDAVDPAYIGYLDDPSSGFNKVLVKDIKLDLFKNYGKIRSTDLLANNKRLEEDWDPADTFQTSHQAVLGVRHQCWTTLQWGAGTSQGLWAIVFNTRLYHDALEKWEEVPVGRATYDNFCKHMIHAKVWLQSKKTSKQQVYGLAAAQIHELTKNFCNLVLEIKISKVMGAKGIFGPEWWLAHFFLFGCSQNE
jgi:hypothetical protein